MMACTPILEGVTRNQQAGQAGIDVEDFCRCSFNLSVALVTRRLVPVLTAVPRA